MACFQGVGHCFSGVGSHPRGTPRPTPRGPAAGNEVSVSQGESATLLTAVLPSAEDKASISVPPSAEDKASTAVPPSAEDKASISVPSSPEDKASISVPPSTKDNVSTFLPPPAEGAFPVAEQQTSENELSDQGNPANFTPTAVASIGTTSSTAAGAGVASELEIEFCYDGQSQKFVFQKVPLGIQFRKKIPLVVTGFQPDSVADQLGVRLGSTFTKIGGVSLEDKTFTDVMEILQRSIDALRTRDGFPTLEISATTSTPIDTAIVWQKNSSECAICGDRLGKRWLRPRHHCRVCGKCVCGKCSPSKVTIGGHAERACTTCVPGRTGSKRQSCVRRCFSKEDETPAQHSELLVTSIGSI